MASYPKEWEKEIVLKNGVHVLLRPELSTDTEMLWKMFSALSKASLENLVLPFTRERIEGWTSNINYDKALPILALIREGKEQSIVGSASLRFHSADALKHKAELGITIHDACQNRGLGTAMINHLLMIARKKGLKKVYLRVNIENAGAIHAYEQCDFKIEARLRMERYQNGKFGDEYRMAIFL